MFGSHVLKYLCSKIRKYFVFLCLVTPYYLVFESSKYSEIGYVKNRSFPIDFQNIQYLGIYFDIEKMPYLPNVLLKKKLVLSIIKAYTIYL